MTVTQQLEEYKVACKYNCKSRQMHHRYNDIKDILSNRITYIDHVKSQKNIMDLFIEGLTRQLIYYL